MQDLTKGSIPRHLATIAAFIAVSMIVQTLYLLADLYFVGRLGKEAIAGVSFAGNLMMVTLAITQMLAVGTTTLVAHAAGRQDRVRATHVFNQAFALSLAVGLVAGGAGWLLRGAYCRALGADAETALLGARYLDWYIPALALQFIVVAMGAAQRGSGVVRPAMVVQVLSVLCNIVLAPILTLGWLTGRPYGVAGAGAATFLATAAGVAVYGVWFVRGERFLAFSPRDWRPEPATWKGLLKIGLPAGGEFLLMSLYLLLIYRITRPLGAAAQAGFGIGGRVMQSMFLPVMAIAFAAAPIAGQNFGARNAARVRETFRVAAVLSCACMAILTLACHLSPAGLIALFSPDPDVIAFGAEFLRMISWNFLATGLIFTSASLFQGMGNTLPPLAASSLRLLLFALPAYLVSLRPGFDIDWIWSLSIASVAIQATVNLLLLRREFGRRLRFDPLVAPAAPVPVPAAAT
ncbi:MAG TPA: MATE family efflux transporter [Verrucomicrobiae bacterium]|nr:MATE family efflux transporter [Verrucomicrobiae bacterium]